jgi:hypothetical protein
MWEVEPEELAKNNVQYQADVNTVFALAIL